MPVIRDLGVEEEIKKVATYKPGATFCIQSDVKSVIQFDRYPGVLANYAYNVPRVELDKILLNAAEKAGVKIIDRKAEITAKDNHIKLSDSCEALLREVIGVGDVLYVDATGRSRQFAKALGVKERVGKRSDYAVFSHWDHIELENPGHIHINRIKYGWCWRIPLPGRVSLGIVISPEHLKKFGETTEEQYLNFVSSEETLKAFSKGAKKIAPVMKYSNYQLVSNRLIGPNWAMVGDSAGFVDPIFSSGVNLALNGARALAKAILKGGQGSDLLQYEKISIKRLECWQQIVESFYDGRLFGLIRAQEYSGDIFPWNLILPTIKTNLEKVFSGMVSPDSYSFHLAKSVIKLKYAEKFGSRLSIR